MFITEYDLDTTEMYAYSPSSQSMLACRVDGLVGEQKLEKGKHARL